MRASTIEKLKKEIIKKSGNYFNSLKLDKFVIIKAGSFTMGSPEGERGRGDDEWQHEVKISKDFYISRYEVTQDEYESIMNNNPSNPVCGVGENFPVNSVSWYDAIEYCNKLSQKQGLRTAYRIIKNVNTNTLTVALNENANGFRLPTEAEWEYAARGGGFSKAYIYAGSNNIDAVARYKDNSCENAHPVGSKLPNELGIYDMSGNVWEWCFDCYDKYPKKEIRTDPVIISTTNDEHVCRGGSWHSEEEHCRNAIRFWLRPDIKSRFCGFRVVLPAEDE